MVNRKAPGPLAPARPDAESPIRPLVVDPARAEAWQATMAGHSLAQDIRTAHGGDGHYLKSPDGGTLGVVQYDRAFREDLERQCQSAGSTFSIGAGNRGQAEEPDQLRTCFERDRDRILHSKPFRRLVGKTQVFVHPEDHQRTRLTHALEVSQVAVAIARAVGCNVALTEAIALGHDCGHGPGGHASEDAFNPYLADGYDHAVFGADVVLESLNLCSETLDGIRNHSWSRPNPNTPEGEIVSWADRIAYVCHDMEDATHAGIVAETMLPPAVRERAGVRRSQQLGSFITGVVQATAASGQISMFEPLAESLEQFRAFNYEQIYMRPASLDQSESVIRVLRALVEYYSDRPNTIGEAQDAVAPGSPEAVLRAVTWVGGMTDRYAFAQAQSLLNWSPADLPQPC